MPLCYWYILECNPEPWEVGPLSVGRKNGKMFPIVGRDQQLHAYKEAVKEALSLQSPVFMEGKLVMSIWFWRVQANYQTPQARGHRKHEADCTNLFKATEDACQGILFKNDKDNVETHGYIVEQGPDVNPLIIIRLQTASDLISREQEMLNMMPGAVQEEYLAHKLQFATNGLLAANSKLKADEDWDGGDF